MAITEILVDEGAAEDTQVSCNEHRLVALVGEGGVSLTVGESDTPSLTVDLSTSMPSGWDDLLIKFKQQALDDHWLLSVNGVSGKQGVLPVVGSGCLDVRQGAGLAISVSCQSCERCQDVSDVVKVLEEVNARLDAWKTLLTGDSAVDEPWGGLIAEFASLLYRWNNLVLAKSVRISGYNRAGAVSVTVSLVQRLPAAMTTVTVTLSGGDDTTKSLTEASWNNGAPAMSSGGAVVIRSQYLEPGGTGTVVSNFQDDHSMRDIKSASREVLVDVLSGSFHYTGTLVLPYIGIEPSKEWSNTNA